MRSTNVDDARKNISNFKTFSREEKNADELPAATYHLKVRLTRLSSSQTAIY